MNCDSFLAVAASTVDNDPVVDENDDTNGVGLIMLLMMNPLYACQRLLMVSHKFRYFEGRGVILPRQMHGLLALIVIDLIANYS